MLYIENVAKIYNGQYILKNINMSINKGEKVGIVGQNGVGKTTLIKLILGTESSDEGSVLLGKDIKISYLPQDSTSLPEERPRPTCYKVSENDCELKR